jgi:hypothetical protein
MGKRKLLGDMPCRAYVSCVSSRKRRELVLLYMKEVVSLREVWTAFARRYVSEISERDA